jgi:hypothetical protein
MDAGDESSQKEQRANQEESDHGTTSQEMGVENK